MATELRRRPITVDEYHRMLDVGILREGEPVEFLRGDLVEKVTVKDAHRACVNRLVRLLRRLEDRAVIQVQNPSSCWTTRSRNPTWRCSRSTRVRSGDAMRIRPTCSR